MVTEDRLKRIRASICLLPDPGYEVAIELLEEIARLREGLRLITCESVNAEYMAQNILDGLPAYHDTMIKPSNAGHEATPVRAVASMNQLDGGETEDV